MSAAGESGGFLGFDAAEMAQAKRTASSASRDRELRMASELNETEEESKADWSKFESRESAKTTDSLGSSAEGKFVRKRSNRPRSSSVDDKTELEFVSDDTIRDASGEESSMSSRGKSSSQSHGKFKDLSLKEKSVGGGKEYRCMKVPGHRMIHVRRLWKDICDPVVKQLKLQIRMNSKKNLIEIRTSTKTTMSNAIQKGSDFIRACILGFEIRDAISLIRLDDIYLESFDIRDVKFFNKKSDHWMRAIGRIAGQYGKIKYSIENSCNCRVVIFGYHIHILGSYMSIRLARNSISRLVIGSAPGNVYAKLRTVSTRLKHKI